MIDSSDSEGPISRAGARGDLQQGEGNLLLHPAVLRQRRERKEMREELLRAIRERDENITAAFRALCLIVRDNRARIERLERKLR